MNNCSISETLSENSPHPNKCHVIVIVSGTYSTPFLQSKKKKKKREKKRVLSINATRYGLCCELNIIPEWFLSGFKHNECAWMDSLY